MHASAEQILRWFQCDHLPPHLRAVVSPFGALASEVALRGGGPECTTALRKLLEAKDAAVRAAIVMREAESLAPEVDPDADTVVTEPQEVRHG